MKKWTTPLMLALPLALAGCTAAPSIPVAFGSPTYVHRLTYDTLYSAKPFTEATLYYYDNGTYKIISPGEEHYGVYVVKGDFDAPRYAITYISLPSTDWYGNVALHELLFDAGNGKFGQQALLPSDQDIPPQDGHFVLQRNSIDDPRPLRWPSN